MRVFIASVGVVFIALVTTSALAQQADCEAARCAVQQAIDQNCSCSAASNHGRYVSCVARRVKTLSKAGQIPANCMGKVKRCAARSICGKSGFVTCQIPVFGTCDTVTGTCTKGTLAAGLTVCAANTECVAGTKCKIKSTDQRCTAAGGTVGTSPTCCSNCVTPAP